MALSSYHINMIFYVHLMIERISNVVFFMFHNERHPSQNRLVSL